MKTTPFSCVLNDEALEFSEWNRPDPKGMPCIAKVRAYGCAENALASSVILSNLRAWVTLLISLLSANPVMAQAQFAYIVTPENTVTIIGYTGSLETINIPGTINQLPVTCLGNGVDPVFNDSALTGVNIPDGVTSIANSAFEGACLASVTLSSNVTNIGSYAFYSCPSLTNVMILNGVTSLGDFAFAVCTNLASVTIPGSVTSIGDFGFYYCLSLTNAVILGSVGGIGNWTFSECSRLASVTLPGSLTNIGQDAFSYCAALGSITLPAGITSLGDYAFYDCASLTGVYFMGNAPAADATVFSGNNAATAYYLPGTANWNGHLGDLPAVLWNPLIQTDGSSFGVRSNQFGFNVTGTANIPIVVEASASLAGAVWQPLQSLTLTNGLVYFSDAQWTQYPGRFYRISSP